MSPRRSRDKQTEISFRSLPCVVCDAEANDSGNKTLRMSLASTLQNMQLKGLYQEFGFAERAGGGDCAEGCWKNRVASNLCACFRGGCIPLSPTPASPRHPLPTPCSSPPRPPPAPLLGQFYKTSLVKASKNIQHATTRQ